MGGEDGGNTCKARGQSSEDANLRCVRMNYVRFHPADQIDKLEGRAKIFHGPHRLYQVRHYVARNTKVPDLLHQIAVFADADHHVKVLAESTQEIEKMNLGATEFGTRDQI
jgi:hypothetical protein